MPLSKLGPNVQLTREQAFDCLLKAGFLNPSVLTNLNLMVPLRTLMVAIGGAESDLWVNAEGAPNSDGSVDHGVWQINDRAWAKYDVVKLLNDPYYCGQAAQEVYKTQGARAWAAYSVVDKNGVYPYSKRMPPGLGGPLVGVGTNSAPEINKSVQAFLNTATPMASPTLVVDGSFGPMSEAALVTWKRVNHNDGTKTVDSRCWTRMGIA